MAEVALLKLQCLGMWYCGKQNSRETECVRRHYAWQAISREAQRVESD